MKIKEGYEGIFSQYKESADNDSNYKELFDIACKFAEGIEKAAERSGKEVSEIFVENLKDAQVFDGLSGMEKNSVFVFLGKTWEFGKDFESFIYNKQAKDYNVSPAQGM